jgi:hypothetical protein
MGNTSSSNEYYQSRPPRQMPPQKRFYSSYDEYVRDRGEDNSALNDSVSPESHEGYWGNFYQYIAFIGACVDRKTREISDYIQSENQKALPGGSYNNYSRAGVEARRRRYRRKQQQEESQDSLPTSARSNSSRIIDRDEHLQLSARSIAIQKKAPLFRDNGEEEFFEHEYLPSKLSGQKIDMSAIDRMIEDDRRRQFEESYGN